MNYDRKRWGLVAPVLLTVLLGGCASTRMTTQLKPALMGRTFAKVMVHGNFQDLEHRQLAEEKLCADLARLSGCECLRSSPPCQDSCRIGWWG